MDLYIGYTEQLKMSNENDDKPKLPCKSPGSAEAVELALRATWPKASLEQVKQLFDHQDTTPHFNGSFAELLRLLPVGKSVAKVELIDWDNLPPAGDTDRLIQMREKIRNSLASTINRARNANGGFYKIEVGETSMPSGSIYVTAVITRTS